MFLREHETFVENLRKWELLLGAPDRWFWLWKKDQLVFVSKGVFSHWFGTIVPPPQTRTSINLKKRGYLRVLRIVSWHMPKNCPWEAQWAHNLRIFFCDTIHNGVQYILQGMLSSSHSCICPIIFLLLRIIARIFGSILFPGICNLQYKFYILLCDRENIFTVTSWTGNRSR